MKRDVSNKKTTLLNFHHSLTADKARHIFIENNNNNNYYYICIITGVSLTYRKTHRNNRRNQYQEFADGETLQVPLYNVLAQSHFDCFCEVWD